MILGGAYLPWCGTGASMFWEYIIVLDLLLFGTTFVWWNYINLPILGIGGMTNRVIF